MDEKVLDFYGDFSIYTNPGLYQNLLSELPNDIQKIGELIRKNFIQVEVFGIRIH